MRRRSKEVEVTELGPLVCDSQGRPVGVHVDAAAPIVESPQARRLRGMKGLRRTHELDGQYDLRLGVSLFCSSPPR